MDNKICKIEDCDFEIYSLGMCSKHYRRFKRHGNPTITLRKHERHGFYNSSLYRRWDCILQRCTNPNNKDYKNYGGRGIKVCDRWLNSFSAFYEDMGDIPFKDAQIDREDNDGDYTLKNCRWTTSVVNAQNRRSNVLNWFTVRSIRRLYALKKYLRKDLCKIYNLKFGTLKQVIYNQTWKGIEPLKNSF